VSEGIISTEREGRKLYYRRTDSPDISEFGDVLHFCSEALPCGVIGSYLLDKEGDASDVFTFKHHYMTGAMDSGVIAALFKAMQQKNVVTVSNLSRKRRSDEPRRNRIIPLRIFISAQSGRQHLLAYQPDFNCIKSFRIDYLSNVKLEGPTPRFDELRERLDEMENKMWGVNVKRNKYGEEHLEHVEFTIRIGRDEEHIVQRLEREKRVGKVEKIDERTYRFTADVYDSGEMIPWIRTFICRIVQMNFSNRTVENMFKSDLEAMYRIYGIREEGSNDIQ
jgi:predicted DNA-binding transcriptional regulator YafY